MLEHQVVGTGADEPRGVLLADLPRYDNDGYVAVMRADERQGSEGAEFGQRVITGDEVPGLPGKGSPEAVGSGDALHNDELIASVTKLTQDQCRIIFAVFDEEHPEGSHLNLYCKTQVNRVDKEKGLGQWLALRPGPVTVVGY